VTRILGLTILLTAAATCAFAGIGAPEIDASSGMAAIALLSGGMVVLWGRRRGNKE
jgi:hypothetical protein